MDLREIAHSTALHAAGGDVHRIVFPRQISAQNPALKYGFQILQCSQVKKVFHAFFGQVVAKIHHSPLTIEKSVVAQAADEHILDVGQRQRTSILEDGEIRPQMNLMADVFALNGGGKSIATYPPPSHASRQTEPTCAKRSADHNFGRRV